MTDLQEKELELLRQFLAVCGKLQLPYYLVCGSALGAVKYGGFIPWDDDIDVAMPRPAYDRFLKEAPSLLPTDLFLQNSESEPAFPVIYSKLRDSRTTFIEKSWAHLPINHGVYIDIFPLDGYPKAKRDQRRLEALKQVYSLQTASAFQLNRRFAARVFNTLLRLLGYHRRTAKTVRKYRMLVAAYPWDTSDVVCNHGGWQGIKEYAPKTQYGEGKWAMFEGISVRIPEQTDAYLTQKYGDWRSELPAEEQKSHHGCVVCDLERPYTFYSKA